MQNSKYLAQIVAAAHKRHATTQAPTYRIGDHIEVLSPLGDIVCGFVVSRSEDIRDGIPGCELAREPGGEAFRWAYDSEIIGVTPGGE